MDGIPPLRACCLNDQEPQPDGEFVLYWMIANRRGTYNFSLQRAAAWAKQLGKPLVILEALRSDYRWASDRLHQFVIEGMADNAKFFAKRPALYYPYVEPSRGAGGGLMRELASRACVVVTDDFPCFFLPRMTKAVSLRAPVLFEMVDSNGLLPMRAADKVFVRAYDLRRFLQKNLLPHLAEAPAADPLQGVELPRLASLPDGIAKRWPAADCDDLRATDVVTSLPIDHTVRPVEYRGGPSAASAELYAFLETRLAVYAVDRNQPEREATSGLSPYLHFGHISVHQIFEEVMQSRNWDPGQVAEKATGSSSGWWGLDEAAESFLDELITWRELGFNMCSRREDYDQYESLPDWAQATLAEHADDPRPSVYALEEFESAATHDPLWNAAQRQLVREGRIHNYLRMLWGKKILHWAETPRTALEIMIELNNKYAVDGRNPNSYSGIFWVLGRYDRPWGPEREIFGKIRYMTSDNTARKVKVKSYIEKYSEQRGLF